MGYLGNTPTTQSFTPQVDYFSGNGSTTAFTLSRQVASVDGIIVVVANVPQNPGSAYSINGNTITFTSAPPSGVNNIWVEYTSLISQIIQPAVGAYAGGTMYINNQTILSPTVIPIGFNAISVGPITASANVTVQNGSRWVIV